MDKKESTQYTFRDKKNSYNISSVGDKFELVSCPAKEAYCKKVLPKINELYAISELARINKEYYRSAELLEKAYDLTRELESETACAKCVKLFQSTITDTMENMQEEVLDMSVGFFHKKRYKHVYASLGYFLRKMRFFVSDGIRSLSPAENTTIS